MPAIVRFIVAHFTDLIKLKIYLETLLGGEFLMDQLEATKLIIDKITKYFLMPGLDVFVKMNWKIVSSNNDIIVTVSNPEVKKTPTPDAEFDHDKSSIDIFGDIDDDNFAVKLSADFSLLDIFEDGVAIEKSIKTSFNGKSE